MSAKKEAYKKYYDSDIFNTKPNDSSTIIKKMKLRMNHPMYDSTKEIIFNLSQEKRIKRNGHKKEDLKQLVLSKSEIRRKHNYEKTYASDIFNQRRATSSERKKGVKRFADEINKITCLNGMGDEKQYIRDLKHYTKTHRAEEKEYIPIYSLKRITPQERYYREHFLNHGALPEINDLYNTSEIMNTEEKKINNYIYRKKNLNKDLIVYNNVGADKKGIKVELNNNNKKYLKKKGLNLYEGRRNFVEPYLYPNNSCKINKQIQLESQIFSDESDRKDFKEEAEKINDRLEKEKKKHYHVDIFGRPLIRIKKDIINSNRNLYGSVHSKWNRTNLDWASPKCQIIFNNSTKDSKCQTARQRKLSQFSDSQNYDILTGREKEPIIYNYKHKENNNKGKKKFDAIINRMPNLNDGQKLGIKMRVSSLDCTNEQDWDDKVNSLKNFFAKNLYKKSKEKDITGKISEMKNNASNISIYNTQDNIFHDYVITYSTKANKFEKLDEIGIQKLFANKGIYTYDIRKNYFDKGNYNTINIKIKGNDTNNKLYRKVKKLQEELRKDNYKFNIEKRKVKNYGIKSGKVVCNPRAKGGTTYIQYDKNREDNEFKKGPNDVKSRKEFSKQYAQINYKYKRSFL